MVTPARILLLRKSDMCPGESGRTGAAHKFRDAMLRQFPPGRRKYRLERREEQEEKKNEGTNLKMEKGIGEPGLKYEFLLQ